MKVQRSDGGRRSDDEKEAQSDGLRQDRRSHVTASLQRAALCFVVGHLYCTLSHCLQYRQRRRPHTRPNRSPLSGNSSVCVCVSAHISVCVWPHLHRNRRVPLIMVCGFVIMT